MKRSMKTKVALACAAALLPFSSVLGAEVEKRWRFGFNVGGYNGRDEVESQSANILFLTDDGDTEVITIFEDPRSDGNAFSTLGMASTFRATASGQYGINKILVLEFSAGYQKNDVGDIELQFEGQPRFIPPLAPNQRFNFVALNFAAGELTQVPLRVTTLARFRPKYGFNPYIGAGVGWTLVGFDPSAELNQVSRNLDASIGGFAQLLSFGQGIGTPRTTQDLRGASVDARDTFEWHLVAGSEIQLKKKWALVFDLRWSFASRAMRVQFNGQDSLGLAVPSGRRFFRDFDEQDEVRFGPVQVTQGGIVDAGSLQLRPPVTNPTVDCDLTPELCRVVFINGALDGQLDPGYYYIQGGEVRYDHITFAVGFQYTF